MSRRDFRLVYIGRSRLQRNRANLLQTLHMVNAFTVLGLDTTLYLPPWPRSLNVQQRLHDFGIDSPLDIRASQWLHSRWKNTPFVWFNRRLLRQADAVYVRSPAVSLALCARNLPHCLEIHDTDALAADQLATLTAKHRQGVIRWLIPISAAASRVLGEAGAEANRILVAPSGVDLQAFASIAPCEAGSARVPRIVYPGSLSHDRGLGIFENLAERAVADITLLGEQHDHPKALPLLKVMPFVPHREVVAWYGKADMVLLPYQRDLQHAGSISPIKLFEAMAAGRPIVASDLPAIREILRHEQNALLVDPADTEAWIAAIRRLQDEPALANRLALAAREKARDYGWEQRAERIARACGWLE